MTAPNVAISSIAVLGGTGALGSGLALRWARAGYRVIIGSRDAERAQAKAGELGALAGVAIAAMSYAEAAAAADLSVLAVPFRSQEEVLLQVREALAGKVLVDCTAPLAPPKVARVQMPPEGSAGIRAQQILGERVRVVSAFQDVGAKHLHHLDRPIDCDVLVCGDDKEARALVAELVDAAGMRGVIAGPLANSVAAEAMTSLLIFINKHYGCNEAGIRITGLPEAGVRQGEPGA
ncbi:MAG: NADPH-dependent F420 reductase [Hyphomonadaceae bacterium]|nr:NADPH-dependent F420 reductase [Hyphomonadaceae bacterium]